MENTKFPRLATIKVASEESGLSYDCIRKLCLQGKIIYIKTGAKFLINMDRFIDFLNGKEKSG